MKLTVLGSSSSGNGYIIQSDGEALVIEAGVSLNKLKQALGFNVSKVAGVLISHLHGDHSKFAKDYSRCFPIYTIESVIAERQIQATEIFPEKGFKVGNFKVFPFAGSHDTPVVGFVVSHPKVGNLLFVTDSFMCEYSFEGLNHILIEANYIDEILNYNVENGLHHCVRDRVLTSHMEIQTTKQVLLNQNLDKVQNIVLIHLSGNNSDPKRMKEIISGATGKPVYIAKSGLELELSYL